MPNASWWKKRKKKKELKTESATFFIFPNQKIETGSFCYGDDKVISSLEMCAGILWKPAEIELYKV